MLIVFTTLYKCCSNYFLLDGMFGMTSFLRQTRLSCWPHRRRRRGANPALTSASNSSAYLSASTVDENSFDHRMSRQKVAVSSVRTKQRPIRHHNRWRQRHAKLGDRSLQQVVVGKAETSGLLISPARKDQIQNVAADESWNAAVTC